MFILLSVDPGFSILVYSIVETGQADHFTNLGSMVMVVKIDLECLPV